MRSTRFRLHVGIEGETGKGDGKGRRGGGKESGCMSPRWVGSDAFLLVPFPFLSLRGQLDRDPGARHANRSRSTTHLSSKSQYSYIVSTRSQPSPLAMCSTTNHPSNHQGCRLPPTISSTGTFSFRKLRHRVLKVGGLIIKHSLNDGVAAQRGDQFEASSKSIGHK